MYRSKKNNKANSNSKTPDFIIICASYSECLTDVLGLIINKIKLN